MQSEELAVNITNDIQEPVKPMVATATQPETATLSATKPKPAGGARIVIPKHLPKTTVVMQVESGGGVKLEEVREVVQVSAGPRIVKPTNLQENESAASKGIAAVAKKVTESAFNRIKQVKEGLAGEKKATETAVAKKIKPVPGKV